jgi:hypothetical protein
MTPKRIAAATPNAYQYTLHSANVWQKEVDGMQYEAACADMGAMEILYEMRAPWYRCRQRHMLTHPLLDA